MSPEETVLALVISTCSGLDIPYMLTGSVAASVHGRPRATHDADVVIAPNAAQLDQLVQSLMTQGFYADRDAARTALLHHRQFNVIEVKTACKVDLIIRRTHPFSIEEFGRRVAMDLPFGQGIFVVTAEDSILSKLHWAKQSGDSARQVADAAAIVAMNPSLDRTYVTRWAQSLGVSDLWEQLLK